MTELTASRTLVKSPPELWAECSDAASLNRHLDRFGEIRITRLEPEMVVAWEGESASGTVRLEPSGWGTRVVLTAQPARLPDEPAPVAAEESEPVAHAESAPVAPEEPEPVAHAEPEPVAVTEPLPHEGPSPDQAPRRTVFGRLLQLFRRAHPAPPAPGRAPEPETESTEAAAIEVSPPEPAEAEAIPDAPPEPVALEEANPAIAFELLALEQALDSLGQAHHRPFSRA